MSRLARAVFVLGAFAACGGADLPGRPARLVSRDLSVDASLDSAARAADDGDLPGAQRILASVLSRAPGDALAPVVRVRLARLRVALDDLDGARAQLDALRGDLDPALAMRRDLVAGLIEARHGRVQEGLRVLQPLSRRLIDRGDSVEVDCGIAALKSAAGDAAAALLALARVESFTEAGARWLPTGLACDQTALRGEAYRALLARVETPQSLADTLDALPSGHSLRVDTARRLRALAEARNEIPRWLRWLADLPDTEATLRVVRDTEGPPVLRVGLLAPSTGPRAYVGSNMLRAVQIALEDQRNVQVEVEDEGTTRDDAVRAFEHLAAGHPAGVVGPALEDHAAVVAPRAEALGVETYLVVPHVDDAVVTAHVHVAGPSPRDRAVALAGATRRRGVRVRWTAAPGAERDLFALRLRESLGRVSVAVLDPVNLSATELHIVTGPWGLEARMTMAARASASPQRWVFDARSALPGAPGVWVGLVEPNAERATGDAGAPPPDVSALRAFRARFCALTGAAPDEMALLAWDATRALAARSRGVAYVSAFPRPWVVRASDVGVGSAELAATQPCPVAPSPL